MEAEHEGQAATKSRKVSDKIVLDRDGAANQGKVCTAREDFGGKAHTNRFTYGLFKTPSDRGLAAPKTNLPSLEFCGLSQKSPNDLDRQR